MKLKVYFHSFERTVHSGFAVCGRRRSWFPNFRACQTQNSKRDDGPSDVWALWSFQSNFNGKGIGKLCANLIWYSTGNPRCNSELKVIFSTRSPISVQFQFDAQQKYQTHKKVKQIFEGSQLAQLKSDQWPVSKRVIIWYVWWKIPICKKNTKVQLCKVIVSLF